MAETERQTTATLMLLLAEVDERRLYLGEGYSSLFVFCTRALWLSESAACARITAARTARRFPVILSLLGDGAISLTTVGLLAPHLTDDNHERILDAARHQSKREVERLVAGMQPQPDIASSVRALPVARSAQAVDALPNVTPPLTDAPSEMPLALAVEGPSPDRTVADSPEVTVPATPSRPAPLAVASARRSVVAPIAPKRYLLRITVGEETHRKLERAQALLRHQIPDGDPAAIIDQALTVLLELAERTKFAATTRPASVTPPGPARTGTTEPSADSAGARPRGCRSRSRRIPAAVRRAVWARDDGRCAFAGSDGRCDETGFLEFHHVVPFAAGGPSTVDNLQMRCQVHNAYEAEREFGDWRLRAATRRSRRAPSGRS